MLRRRARRRRQRRHRLDALALAGQQQAGAVIPQRTRPIRVPDHPDKLADVVREPLCSLFGFAENYPSLRILAGKSPLNDSQMYYPAF